MRIACRVEGFGISLIVFRVEGGEVKDPFGWTEEMLAAVGTVFTVICYGFGFSGGTGIVWIFDTAGADDGFSVCTGDGAAVFLPVLVFLMPLGFFEDVVGFAGHFHSDGGDGFAADAHSAEGSTAFLFRGSGVELADAFCIGFKVCVELVLVWIDI